jgi:multidrug resistance protein, MATE family
LVVQFKGQWQQEVTALIRLGWPLIVANLAQFALTTTDVVIMGHYSAETLAAGSLGANFYVSFFVIGMGMANATAPLLAQALGRKYRTHTVMRLVLHQGVIATLIFSLLTWAILSQTEAFLIVIGEPVELAKGAATYVSTLKWGLLPALWFVILRCFVSALERPKAALIATLVAIVSNGIACWALMFGRLGSQPTGP